MMILIKSHRIVIIDLSKKSPSVINPSLLHWYSEWKNFPWPGRIAECDITWFHGMCLLSILHNYTVFLVFKCLCIWSFLFFCFSSFTFVSVLILLCFFCNIFIFYFFIQKFQNIRPPSYSITALYLGLL